MTSAYFGVGGGAGGAPAQSAYFGVGGGPAGGGGGSKVGGAASMAGQSAYFGVSGGGGGGAQSAYFCDYATPVVCAGCEKRSAAGSNNKPSNVVIMFRYPNVEITAGTYLFGHAAKGYTEPIELKIDAEIINALKTGDPPAAGSICPTPTTQTSCSIIRVGGPVFRLTTFGLKRLAE